MDFFGTGNGKKEIERTDPLLLAQNVEEVKPGGSRSLDLLIL